MYLKSLILTLEMDREIDCDKHFITPGGYYMTDKDGQEFAFDFFNTSGTRWSKNPFRIEYTCDGLDLDAFPMEMRLESIWILSLRFLNAMSGQGKMVIRKST